MTEREALLQAVYANPNDDLPRVVFADWCDEHGEPERAEFIRLQVDIARRGTPATEDELLRVWQLETERDRLLDPADREAFELLPAAPEFARGFMCGVVFRDYQPWRTDPPLLPVEEVGDAWHHLCDVVGRNPLVGEITRAGWFELRILPAPFGRVVMPFLTFPGECRRCRGDGCRDCGGLGTTDSPAGYEVVTDDWAAVDPILRWRSAGCCSTTTTRTSKATACE